MHRRAPHWLIGDFCELWRLASAAHGGGAIDENIDAVELAEHLGYGSLDGGIIAGVGDISLHAAIRCSSDFRGGGLKCGAIPRNQGDIHTATQQPCQCRGCRQ